MLLFYFEIPKPHVYKICVMLLKCNFILQKQKPHKPSHADIFLFFFWKKFSFISHAFCSQPDTVCHVTCSCCTCISVSTNWKVLMFVCVVFFPLSSYIFPWLLFPLYMLKYVDKFWFRLFYFMYCGLVFGSRQVSS